MHEKDLKYLNYNIVVASNDLETSKDFVPHKKDEKEKFKNQNIEQSKDQQEPEVQIKPEEKLEQDPDEIPDEAPAEGETTESEGGGDVFNIVHNPLFGDPNSDPENLEFDFDKFEKQVELALDKDPLVVFFLDESTIFEFLQQEDGGVPDILQPSNDNYSTLGNTQLQVMANNPGASFAPMLRLNFANIITRQSNENPKKVVMGSVLDNDQGAGLSVIGIQNVTQGAVVVMMSDGTFSYTPPVGLTDVTDQFEYIIEDQYGQTAVGTVNIELSQTIWYVDNTNFEKLDSQVLTEAVTQTGTGLSNDPFTSLAIFNTDARPDAIGDYIFIIGGGEDYTSGIKLLDSQVLAGSGQDFIVDDSLIYAATIAPTISQTPISLNNNTVISGLSFGGFETSALLINDLNGNINIANNIFYSDDQNPVIIINQLQDLSANLNLINNLIIYQENLREIAPSITINNGELSELFASIFDNTILNNPQTHFIIDNLGDLEVLPGNSMSLNIEDIIADNNPPTEPAQVIVIANNLNPVGELEPVKVEGEFG